MTCEKIGPVEIIMGEREYPYDQVLNMSGTNVIMLHAPGHSEGFCCPYFPDYGILHIGDIDLTSFGPWYFSPDSNIDQFIQSAKKMLEVDARYYTTSHQKGTVGRAEFREKLQPYLDKIELREERIIHAVRSGCSPEELVCQDIFFYRKHLEQYPVFLRMEKIGLAKHLTRLINRGEPFADYLDQFAATHQMKREYIDHFSQPCFCGAASVNRY